MLIFYHVDRNMSLKQGQKIELVHYNDIKPEKLQKHVDQLFPKGFSSHGEKYFLQYKIIKFLQSKKNPNIIETNMDSINIIIEILFEYIRRSNFPDKPSRFQFLHAFQSIDNTINFRKEFCNSKGYIWKVECDNYFKADMNLLNLGNCSSLELSYNANKYWSGLPGEDKVPFWEFLLTIPVRVLKRID